jgi:hypothetical protein
MRACQRNPRSLVVGPDANGRLEMLDAPHTIAREPQHGRQNPMRLRRGRIHLDNHLQRARRLSKPALAKCGDGLLHPFTPGTGIRHQRISVGGITQSRKAFLVLPLKNLRESV